MANSVVGAAADAGCIDRLRARVFLALIRLPAVHKRKAAQQLRHLRRSVLDHAVGMRATAACQLPER